VGEFRGRGGLAEGPTDYAALSWGLGAGSTKTPILAIAGGSLAKSETLHSLYLLLSRLSGLDAPQVDFEQMVHDMAGMASTDAITIESTMPSIATDSPELVLHRALSGEVTSLHEAALSRLPGANEALTKVATSAFNDQIRAEAISALGDLGDPRTIGFVSQVLLKSKFPVSKACARVLSNLKDPSTIPVLIKGYALRSGMDVKSGSCGSTGGVRTELCAADLSRPRGGFRARVVCCRKCEAGLVQYESAAEPALLAFLKDPDADMHLGKDVVDILGLVGEQNAVPAVQVFSNRLQENPGLGALTGCA
jgi:hypothetical protein